MSDDVNDLITRGREVLRRVPSRVSYATSISTIRKNASSSRQTNQLAIVKKEFESEMADARREYTGWFATLVSFCELYKLDDVLKKIKDTKQILELENRIERTIELLEGISNDVFSKADVYSLRNVQKESSSVSSDDVALIVSRGESDVVEFKSSLRWDVHKNELNKFLEIPVAKTLCAMLNSRGGSLVIGVGDDGNVIGIERDYPTLRRQDSDGFVQFLIQVINNKLGKEINQFLQIGIVSAEDHDVCVVRVSPSQKPVFMKHDNKEEFYIRASATNQPLNVRETSEYITMHFK